MSNDLKATIAAKPRGVLFTCVGLSIYLIEKAIYLIWSLIDAWPKSSLLGTAPDFPSFLAFILPKTIIVVVTLVLTIGLFNLKRWGYYGFIILAIFQIFSFIRILKEVALSRDLFLISVLALTLVFFIGAIGYLVLRPVRDAFNISFKDLPQLGITAIGVMLILINGKNLIENFNYEFEFTIPAIFQYWVLRIVPIIFSIYLIKRKEWARKATIGFLIFYLFVTALMGISSLSNIIFYSFFCVILLIKPLKSQFT